MSGDRDRILESHNVNIVGNAASDRTLVFSHGFGADQTEWDSIVPGLADEYRCVLLDHAGAGRSQPDTYDTRRHSRMHGHAEDLVAIVEALGLKGCTVVAHSAGGIIALLAAADRPELFPGWSSLAARPDIRMTTATVADSPATILSGSTD